jgi:high-affinity iron transporter
MIPTFLITFREVIEASLIVATIFGLLVKLKQKKEIRTVWLATFSAAGVSILLIGVGSLVGLEIHTLFNIYEPYIEGILMIVSAVFITWAVFFLHNHFASSKTQILTKMKGAVEKEEQRGLFTLVFTAVFREGFEIFLFLSTVYFSSDPINVLVGFALGTFVALLVAIGLFTSTLKLPIRFAFKSTSLLLVLFAAGLLARGVHEFTEIGILPETLGITWSIIPEKTTFLGDILNAIFGITQNMNVIQVGVYVLYFGLMTWWLFIRDADTRKVVRTE